MRAMMVIEAIHSVALEHDASCDCVTCRAARGDRTALAEILVAVELDRRRDGE